MHHIGLFDTLIDTAIAGFARMAALDDLEAPPSSACAVISRQLCFLPPQVGGSW